MTELDTTVRAADDDPESSQEVHNSPPDPMESSPASTGNAGRRWRRAGWLVAFVVLVAVAGAAWWVGASSQSPDQAAARAAEPDASWVTAPVEFRVLSSTIITRGDVRPETSTAIGAPVSVEGTAVVTKRVVTVGDVVAEGERVLEVSGRPVFVLEGDATIYRTLQPGMVGDDVTAVQTALARLGYQLEATGVFDDATKLAVAALYADAGYDPIPTSAAFPADLAVAERAVTDAETAAHTARADLAAAVEGPAGSEVAAADAAVDAANSAVVDARATRVETVDQAEIALDVANASRDETQGRADATVEELNAANVAVHDAEITLAAAKRHGDAAVAAAEDQLQVAVLARQELDERADTAALQAAVDAADAAVTDARNALAELQRVNGPTVAQGEIVFVTTTPARVLSTPATATDPNPVAGDGGGGDNTAVLMSLASGDLVVDVTVRPDQVGLVSTGQDVTLLDELTDTAYPATVVTIAEEATTDTSGQLGHRITITPATPLPDDLAGSNLRVTLTSASTGTKQLVVPVAAVTAAADGTTRVSILDDTGTPIDVEVTAGLSADGFVAIEPANPDLLDADSAVIVGR